jgi:hypothetical protein
MPAIRMSRRTVMLGLLASPALFSRGMPAFAQDATPATGSNRIVGELFGYVITWPDSWTFVASGSEGNGEDGYDMVQLAKDDATAYIVVSRPGDTPLSEIVELLADGPERETFVPGMIATDTEGKEIIGETPDRAWAAWNGNLAGEIVDGFTQFRYGEIRLLEQNLGVGLSVAMPATSFDKDIAPYSALLDGVTKGEGTPTAD